MIAAGDLTERITFERANAIVGPGGKVTTVWTAIATVWAQELDPIAAETADANGVLRPGASPTAPDISTSPRPTACAMATASSTSSA